MTKREEPPKSEPSDRPSYEDVTNDERLETPAVDDSVPEETT